MSMTLQTITQAAEANIISLSSNPSLNIDVSQGMLNLWANSGYQDVNASYRWPWLFAQAQTTLTVGSPVLDVPSDLGIMVTAYDRDGVQELTYVDARQQFVDQPEGVQANGVPSHYYRVGNDFFVWPVPAVAHVVLMRYYKMVPDLGINDSPIWPAQFHHSLIDFVTWKALNHLSAGRPEHLSYRMVSSMETSAKAYQEEFNQAMQRMQNSYLSSETDDKQFLVSLWSDVYIEGY